MNQIKKNLIRNAAAAVALAACAVSSAWAVPTFNPATGNWYDVVSSGANGSWQNAENNAIALGGHLVTTNNAAEEIWLRTNFGTQRFWIGFNDVASEGNFVWSSGEAVTYTNWGGGEPNNAGGIEDFAVMNWNQSTAHWNDWSHLRPDFNTFGPFNGIAEYARVPEPTTLLLLGLGLAGLGFARKRLH